MKLLSALAFAAVAASLSPSAHAADITDATPCSAMVAAMDSEKPASIRPFTVYVLNAMDDIDTKQIQAGERGIMAPLSDGGREGLAAVVSVNCRDHPKMTVYNSAAFVYQGVRAMLQLGTAK